MPTSQIEMFWFCGICKDRNLGRDMSCSACGKPKGDEPYVMPDDIEAASEVTAPDLLKKATAGANWKCRFCSSQQRQLGGLCAQCGSNQSDSTDRRETPADPFPASAAAAPPAESNDWDLPPTGGVSATKRPSLPAERQRKGVYVAVAVGALVLGILLFAFWPRTKHMRVEGVTWQQTVTVERYSMRHAQGFYEDEPSDAVNVSSIGPRYHHTEHVPDGYDTISYTVDVPCGERCGPRPPCYTTPRTNCKSNKNGFATCSGGDRVCPPASCQTKYCPSPRTRQEPRYVDVPRYAMVYEWDVWRWGNSRDVAANGTTLATRWPSDDELRLCGGTGRPSCNGQENERAVIRSGKYTVRLSKSGESITYSPGSESEFARFAPGSKWTVKVDALGVVHDVLPE